MVSAVAIDDYRPRYCNRPTSSNGSIVDGEPRFDGPRQINVQDASIDVQESD
jgi:hypothetical protein